jgi:fumarate reductase flavoprotein subunit
MRRFFALPLVLLGVMLLGACSTSAVSSGNGVYTPGTYLSYGAGRGGPILVEVDFTQDRIADVRVLSHHETYLIGNIPVEQYPAQIVANQSLAVDIVSGATISSLAVLNAVRDAVTKAGGNPQDLNSPVPTQSEPAVDTTADVVVIGGGGAGLTAASYAAAAGKKVILVEKLSILGGTSVYSIESFGASETLVHKALGVSANWQTNYNALVAGNPKGKPEAFEVLAHNNGAAADWLRKIGALLPVAGSPTSVAPSREVGKMGVTIVGALIAEAKKSGVDIRLNTKAVELLVSGDTVSGVRVENGNGSYTITAKSVIITTGGFAANNELVSQYKPHLKGYLYSSSSGATGDGHRLAEAVGAQLNDMDYIRVNFTYHNKGGIVYYTGSLANTGGVFVNNNGVRVINEGGGYGVGPTVAENHGGQGWMIFDRSIIDGSQDVREYYELGLYESAPTLGELADKIGVNKTNLLKTIETYQGYVAAGRDPDFNRALLTMTFDEAPFYACKFTCNIQGTFGGIATNTSTQALRADGTVIQGLYAAGECAHVGTYGANPMAVNIVYGRIAGQNAAANAR